MKNNIVVLKVLIVAALFLLLISSLPRPAYAPYVITVNLDKPGDTVKKTDDIKIKGDIDGLVVGKSYIIRIQVYEDGGANYSAPFFANFTVVE